MQTPGTAQFVALGSAAAMQVLRWQLGSRGPEGTSEVTQMMEFKKHTHEFTSEDSIGTHKSLPPALLNTRHMLFPAGNLLGRRDPGVSGTPD